MTLSAVNALLSIVSTGYLLSASVSTFRFLQGYQERPGYLVCVLAI